MSGLPGEDVAKVLVVDDEEVIREILADFLTMEGFYVRTAEDGSGALVELSRDRFDLVLSDLKMPNMGGLELLGAIRKHTPHVVTIIMTGFGTVETAIEGCVRAGTSVSPARARTEFGPPQFHCGRPPPAQEPSTRIRMPRD